MSSFPELRRLAFAGWLGFCVCAAAAPADPFPGIGRAATAKEIEAWDIDVRPDFKGLPKGSGTVAQGQVVWEAKCASCHGTFGESGEVFSPIVGGTTAEDVRTGHVAHLNDRGYPGRTTLMKLTTISTLWDYIHRAMPWNEPKSLSVDEVYGVTAYILNLGNIVPDDFILSDRTMAAAQARLPNRKGATTGHAMWPGTEFGKRKPDVQASACMKDCRDVPEIASSLPDSERGTHGNLADQNRLVGAQRGAQSSPVEAPAKPAAQARSDAAAPSALLDQHACTACHGIERRLIGPAFQEVAKKYAALGDAVAYLAGKIKSGGSGVWGALPMPPQTISDEDARAIAQWLAAGAKN